MTSSVYALVPPSLTAPRARPASWWRFVPYPALLTAVMVVAAWAIRTGQNLPLVATSVIFAAIGVLVLFERLIPFEEAWHPTGRECFAMASTSASMEASMP